MTKKILNEILKNSFITIEIDSYNLEEIFKKIPNSPGIYSIKTDTPIDILRETRERIDKKHYDISSKVKCSDSLPNDFKINQIDNNLYVVYNGHAKKLRQRASEHFKGSKGTGCLALFNIDTLKEYKWSFIYLDLSKIEEFEDCSLLRNYLEQYYRLLYGWPILCSQ